MPFIIATIIFAIYFRFRRSSHFSSPTPPPFRPSSPPPTDFRRHRFLRLTFTPAAFQQRGSAV
jgi:hypothetical protein